MAKEEPDSVLDNPYEDEDEAPERLTFTFGEAPEEEVRERLPEKYNMELNRADMMALLKALGESEDEEAGALRVDILDTLEIEET